MTHPVIERRRAEQDERIQLASAWALTLAKTLDVSAVVVFGSTARGDFNKWSDVDILVVSDALPDGARRRLELLMSNTPPGLQPIGWTPSELDLRRARHDPIAIECDSIGRVVFGALPQRTDG